MKRKKKFKLSFSYRNENPYLRHEDDCAVRALASLYNIKWEDAYKMLFKTALKRKSTVTQIGTVELTLHNSGCTILDAQNAPLIDYTPTPGEKDTSTNRNRQYRARYICR